MRGAAPLSTGFPLPFQASQRGRLPPLAAARVPGPLKVALVLFCGAALGLTGTAKVLDEGINPAALRIGPWVTWPKAGTTEIDPYARAIGARTAAIPLVSAEGVSFTAASDDDGAPLSRRCMYRVSGAMPAARFWTLTALTPDGLVMENPAARAGFSSTEILRRDKGQFDIVTGPSARPGNWLPSSGDGRFILTIRLYDTPLSSITGDIGKSVLPSLTRLGCSS